MPAFWCNGNLNKSLNQTSYRTVPGARGPVERRGRMCVVVLVRRRVYVRAGSIQSVTHMCLGAVVPGPLHCTLPNQIWKGDTATQAHSTATAHGALHWFGLCLLPKKKKLLCEHKILRHIKLAIHAWSTKCRWNQKLIVQLGCTMRDERFEPN
jgi:hypothetical protein